MVLKIYLLAGHRLRNTGLSHLQFFSFFKCRLVFVLRFPFPLKRQLEYFQTSNCSKRWTSPFPWLDSKKRTQKPLGLDLLHDLDLDTKIFPSFSHSFSKAHQSFYKRRQNIFKYVCEKAPPTFLSFFRNIC